jgi:RNA polymerase sigma-70 factor (ECF subfamily)
MKTQPASPEELIGRVAHGDVKALGELHDRYAPRLLGLTLRILGDRRAAEEAVENVFLRVWNQARRFPCGSGSAAAWLVMLARREALDRLRRVRKRPSTSTAASDFLCQAFAWLPRPQDVARLEERNSLVAKLLSQLAPVQRTALDLAVFEGLAEEEIAQRLGEPLAKVKASLRATTAFLRHRLQIVLGPWTVNF